MITDIFLSFRKDPTIKRHLLKTVSWRLVGTIDTAMLGWLITGHLAVGLKIGGMEVATKMFLYFFHERVWHRLKFGRPSRIELADSVRKENSNTLFKQKGKISRKQREGGNKAFTIWLTGLSGAGKSTLAAEIEQDLFLMDLKTTTLDGDNTRLGINSDLSFSDDDRTENIRRIAEICKLFNDSGTIVVASFISPSASSRAMAAGIIGRESFIEVYADAPVAICRKRDVKGLYKMADAGKIKNFTGVDSPYEAPLTPAVHLFTATQTVDECVEKVMAYLNKFKWIKAADKLMVGLSPEVSLK